MFTFLLVVHAIIAAVLVGVILMQKSEGGGLGTGGSPGGLMSARGAADFLTRSTAVLATAFVGMSILLAVLASSGQTVKVDTSLATKPGAPAAPAAAPAPVDAGSAAAIAANQMAPAAAPTGNSAVPLAQ
ncbi:preprotein translocase subunit SecG [Sphingomonas sp. Leaf357]|uniref:preprotein translocase subunit SecG n=1 Tax=Sphingomonas sp. Leaf357 TaxID=1736350 RepID=UPI0007022AA1|nr:preprotein translocase subunit SecG [Sphingomonas sp. Leaf357]KQS04920.1 preprotein translocase subunit SecG [Sphingomonas sp. Leaf357]